MKNVAEIATIYWLAPQAKPIPIIRKRYINSSGSLIAALNLTIDNAINRDNASENLITVITRVVVIERYEKIGKITFIA